MTWLVTGGAGYIGAHVVSELVRSGRRVIVLDDLSTGFLSRIPGATFVHGSTLSHEDLKRAFSFERVQGIVHLAALKKVPESISDPLNYYHQNIEGLRVVLQAAHENKVSSFVFSSSAAVYGSPNVDFIAETEMPDPVNPYGRTKLAGEWLVRDVAQATGMRFCNLRYFNVAGAESPELADRQITNLVPMVFDRLTKGLPPVIFGADYPTRDGSCVRDFVHVSDVASAHAVVALALEAERISGLTANVGRGQGVSVKELILIAREVTGMTEPWANTVTTRRRVGDPAEVVASCDLLGEAVGWRAKRTVHEMVSSAWDGWQAR